MNDYLDDDAVFYDVKQIEWWKKHKEQAHRTEWPYQGVPICYTCASIYPYEPDLSKRKVPPSRSQEADDKGT